MPPLFLQTAFIPKPFLQQVERGFYFPRPRKAKKKSEGESHTPKLNGCGALSPAAERYKRRLVETYIGA